MSKCIDLTNQNFGYWTVIKRAENTKDGRAQWLCKCKCGNEKILNGKVLRNGHSKSCGCYKKEVIKKIKSKDLTQQRFGKLVAVELMEGMKKASNNVWRCMCDCGNETLVASTHLLQGNITSCGCQKSKGEALISNILNQNNISYIREYEFDSCKFNSGYSAKFDFYVENQYLIEYDGEQHFKHHSSGWSNENNLQSIQERDAIKNKWCKDNNIPLIRIPYTHFQYITLEDLRLDTTKFRVE